jgi:hypothetical protein
LADTTSKRVDEISNRPVVKDLVAPVACAVVDGLLGAGDVIVDYALPDAESIVDTSVATKRSEDDQKIVVPHAKKLVSKLGKRLYKRAEGGMSAIEERKEQLRKVKVDLIAYAKGFLGQQKMLLERAAANPKKMTAEKLKSLHEFANAVMEPYRQNIKGKWNDNVQPMFLAVTDYGEYFMEHVSEYEKSSKIDGADVVPSPSTDSDVNRFISRVAHRFIEPTLVRTVAVFMVLGDEMRRLKVQAIEPNVAIAEKKVREAVSEAQRVVKDVVTKMNGRYSAGLKRFDGELVKFEEFKQKLAVHVRQEFDAIVQPVQNKIFAAIQSLPWSGSQPVTLEDFRKTVAEKVGSEYVKYEKYLKPLVQNIHRAIVVAEEWATPWVDAAKDAWTVEATTSHSK